MTASVPTDGQLAEVRKRRWVVTGVRASVSAGLGGPLGTLPAAPQHLVALQSVEDDGHGETLEVIWEIEPGARTIERDALPDPTQGFDAPDRLDAFLDAVRWGAVGEDGDRIIGIVPATHGRVERRV
ncbi:MAG: hypothetical protein VKP57_13520 [Candidatus Sericytochromatia bacterium]|nr:hypothetical protein [Candidatus Sericytochromatia bacterium]